MAKQVFTGWRTVAPGKCSCCGFDDGWFDSDGRGGICCECQRCPECGEIDGHVADCPTVADPEPVDLLAFYSGKRLLAIVPGDCYNDAEPHMRRPDLREIWTTIYVLHPVDRETADRVLSGTLSSRQTRDFALQHRNRAILWSEY